MGRKDKSYYKDLHQQAYDRLTGMQAFGESKRESVKNGTDREKIFSFNTYKAYWKHTKYFVQYIKEMHPECTTLKSAKKYVNEWLQARTEQGCILPKQYEQITKKVNDCQNMLGAWLNSDRKRMGM